MFASRDNWPKQAMRFLVSRDQTAEMCDRDEQGTADIPCLPLHPICFASIDNTVAFAHLLNTTHRSRSEKVSRARFLGK